MWSIRMLMIIITMLLHLLWWCWIWCMIQIYAWFKYDVWFKDTKAINCVRWWQWWKDLRISWTWWGNLFCKQIEIFCKVVQGGLLANPLARRDCPKQWIACNTINFHALSLQDCLKQSVTASREKFSTNPVLLQLRSTQSRNLGNQIWFTFNQTAEFYLINHQGNFIKAPTKL